MTYEMQEDGRTEVVASEALSQPNMCYPHRGAIRIFRIPRPSGGLEMLHVARRMQPAGHRDPL